MMEHVREDWRLRLKLALNEAKAREAGFTVTRFSQSLGFSRDYVGRLANNPRSNPPIGNLEKICDALGISLGYLVTGFDMSEDRARVTRQVSSMDSRDLERLKGFIEGEGIV